MTWTNGGNSRTSTTTWKAIRRAALKRADNRCQQCGASNTPLYCDHITPTAEGGHDHLDNARILCHPCHTPKTRAETARGIARRTARRQLPQKPHPGTMGGG